MSDQYLEIEVVYAKPFRQIVIPVVVKMGSTIQDAIDKSEISCIVEEKITDDNVGIFNRALPLNTVLKNKDRVEIYRELLADPKEIRRRRATQSKKIK